MPTIKPPPNTIGRAPKRSTAHPISGPPALPSARARLNTSDICAEVSPRSVCIGVKKRGNPWEIDPFPNIPTKLETTTTHHP